jgi:lipopolysaccharide/colanic/teichoic acid biosynthesis glycosyltransferase
MLKRIVDVTGSLSLLIFTAPVMILAVLLIRLTSRGAAFCAEPCVGEIGKKFSLFKLRTTATSPEQKAGQGSATVTKIGRLLLATHIDELPQLLNVLIGDMSLVGPSPKPPQFIKKYRNCFPGYELRLGVKPGITGLAQVDCRYSAAPELKLHFDLKYIYNYSLAMDIRILFRTVGTVLQAIPIGEFKKRKTGGSQEQSVRRLKHQTVSGGD